LLIAFTLCKRQLPLMPTTYLLTIGNVFGSGDFVFGARSRKPRRAGERTEAEVTRHLANEPLHHSWGESSGSQTTLENK
jgi:hypothetical protein